MSIVVPPRNMLARRRHPRYPLRHPCVVSLGDVTISALLVDISLGGAGICLPMHVAYYGAQQGRFDRMLFQLEDVGQFRAQTRWSSDRRMGIEFAPTARSAPGLLALIARLEAAHAGDPPLETSGDDPSFARVMSRGHEGAGATQAALQAARQALLRRSVATRQP